MNSFKSKPILGYFLLYGFSLFLAVGLLSCKEPKTSIPVDKLNPGDSLPRIAFSDINGKKVDFGKFEGKVILINFWATWCPPCVAEMPALERLHMALKDDGLAVLAINVDPPKSRDSVLQFVNTNNLSFTILLDPELISVNEFGVTGFPETIFVSREGKIVSVQDPETNAPAVRLLRERAWDSKEYIAMIKAILSEQ